MVSTTRPPVTTSGNGHDDEIWTPADVCARLKINMNQLYKHNASGSFPMYRVGKHCRYLRSEVLRWFVEQDDARDKNVPVDPNDLPDV